MDGLWGPTSPIRFESYIELERTNDSLWQESIGLPGLDCVNYGFVVMGSQIGILVWEIGLFEEVKCQLLFDHFRHYEVSGALLC